ncbi:hypothetical protein AAVH_42088 [Aphelenchoides avenae]|nr:hypothetical protein AAVH_42088 [Aphelenchus avenae]
MEDQPRTPSPSDVPTAFLECSKTTVFHHDGLDQKVTLPFVSGNTSIQLPPPLNRRLSPPRRDDRKFRNGRLPVPGDDVQRKSSASTNLLTI